MLVASLSSFLRLALLFGAFLPAMLLPVSCQGGGASGKMALSSRSFAGVDTCVMLRSQWHIATCLERSADLAIWLYGPWSKKMGWSHIGPLAIFVVL